MRICNKYMLESRLRVRVDDFINVKNVYKVDIVKITISVFEQSFYCNNGPIDDNNKIY